MMSHVRYKNGKPQRLTIDRFLDNVYPEPNTGCWIWSGKLTKKGYGNCSKITLDSHALNGAHRVSYYFHKGEFEYSLLVCHKCDNRWCVNPDHLFLGTTNDNTNDMLTKNRSLKGSDHPHSKLNESQIIDIRKRYEAGNVTLQALSDEYSISIGHLSTITSRINWKHV